MWESSTMAPIACGNGLSLRMATTDALSARMIAVSSTLKCAIATPSTFPDSCSRKRRWTVHLDRFLEMISEDGVAVKDGGIGVSAVVLVDDGDQLPALRSVPIEHLRPLEIVSDHLLGHNA